MTGRNVILLLNALARVKRKYVNVLLVILAMANLVMVGGKSWCRLVGSILGICQCFCSPTLKGGKSLRADIALMKSQPYETL